MTVTEPNDSLRRPNVFVRYRRLCLVLMCAVMAAAGLWLSLSAYCEYRGRVDLTEAYATEVVEAVNAICRQSRERGLPLPRSITLQELVRSGHLRPDILRSFGGLEVNISMSADETRAGSVLTTIRMPDGSTIVGFADGSAHQVSPGQRLP